MIRLFAVYDGTATEFFGRKPEPTKYATFTSWNSPGSSYFMVLGNPLHLSVDKPRRVKVVKEAKRGR